MYSWTCFNHIVFKLWHRVPTLCPNQRQKVTQKWSCSMVLTNRFEGTNPPYLNAQEEIHNMARKILITTSHFMELRPMRNAALGWRWRWRDNGATDMVCQSIHRQLLNPYRALLNILDRETTAEKTAAIWPLNWLLTHHWMVENGTVDDHSGPPPSQCDKGTHWNSCRRKESRIHHGPILHDSTNASYTY